MIVVRIEKWPQGHPAGASILRTIEIENISPNGEGSLSADYQVRVGGLPSHKVRGWNSNKDVVELVQYALQGVRT